jgi:RimJ/RimL family protein N-acetyltransferase
MPTTQVSYHEGDISIHPPDPAAIRNTPVDAEAADSVKYWLPLALDEEQTVIYFSISRQGQLVGHIFLHDMNQVTGEALIGYYLFQPHYRGQGIGAKALRLLLRYASDHTEFHHLVIITGEENVASRRIAEKCGFSCTGPAREGPPLICYEWRRELVDTS